MHLQNQLFVLGSVNQDLVFTTQRLPLTGETLLAKKFRQFAGGKGANQAVAAARQGAKVTFIGAVGNDLFGTHLRELLSEENVETQHLRTIEACATGTACIVVDETGQNSIVVELGANAQVSTEQVAQVLTQARAGSLLLMQLEVPIDVVDFSLKLARKQQLMTLLNPSPVESILSNLQILENVDLLILNQHETEQLCKLPVDTTKVETLQKAYRHLLKLGCKDVLVTLGSQGVFYQSEIFAAPTAKVVDTTGAGDCFAGSLAAAILRNSANNIADRKQNLFVKQCIDEAQAAAAISVGFEGAQTGMPKRPKGN
jgi:ribokinase